MVVLPLVECPAGKYVLIAADTATPPNTATLQTKKTLPLFHITFGADIKRNADYRETQFQCRIVDWPKDSPHAFG